MEKAQNAALSRDIPQSSGTDVSGAFVEKNMGEKKVLAEKLLENLLADIGRMHGAVYKIRGWCITVWMASIAFSITQAAYMSLAQKYLFPFLPILLFWILESFQHTFIHLRVKQSAILEEVLADGRLDSFPTKKLYFYTSQGTESLPAKIRAFLISLFRKETIIIFYLLLIAVSCLNIFFTQD